jgi:hypothetical protein
MTRAVVVRLDRADDETSAAWNAIDVVLIGLVTARTARAPARAASSKKRR